LNFSIKKIQVRGFIPLFLMKKITPQRALVALLFSLVLVLFSP